MCFLAYTGITIDNTEACHATDNLQSISALRRNRSGSRDYPRPSVAIFLAIDGPPGPSMAAMDGPSLVPKPFEFSLVNQPLF